MPNPCWHGAYAAYRSPYVDAGYGQGSHGSPVGAVDSLSSCALNAGGGFGFGSSGGGGVMPVGGQFIGGYHRLQGGKEYCSGDYANLQSASSLTYRHIIQ